MLDKGRRRRYNTPVLKINILKMKAVNIFKKFACETCEPSFDTDSFCIFLFSSLDTSLNLRPVRVTPGGDGAFNGIKNSR